MLCGKVGTFVFVLIVCLGAGWLCVGFLVGLFVACVFDRILTVVWTGVYCV